MVEGKIMYLARICITLFIGRSCMDKLWEQDLFWQLRAGEEIWETFHLQQVDTWTYTVPGVPWHNYCWLSSLIYYGLSPNGTDPNDIAVRFCILRGIFVGIMFWQLTGLISYFIHDIGLMTLITVCVYAAIKPRLQIRPELFTLMLIVLLITLPFMNKKKMKKTTKNKGRKHQKRKQQKRKQLNNNNSRSGWLFTFKLATVIILSACIHDGLVPFVGLIAASIQIGVNHNIKIENIIKVIVLTISSVCHPYPISMILLILHHLPGTYFNVKLLSNPEHKQLSFENFKSGQYIFGLIVWLTLVAISSIGHVYLYKKRPYGYRNFLSFHLTNIALTTASFDRVRVVPFSVLFCLPMILTILKYCIKKYFHFNKIIKTSIGFIITAYIWKSLLYHKKSPNLILTNQMWPIESIAFIRSLPKELWPKSNIYHTYTFGNYLIHQLPEYKVFGDTRETIFKELEISYHSAFSDPSALNRLLKQYDINTIITKIPGTKYLGNGMWIDIIEEFTPKMDWALIFFDEYSIVMLKRIPEHEELIKQYEYHQLNPALLHDHLMQLQSHEFNMKLFGEEIKRCMKFVPNNSFCKLSNIAYQRRKGGISILKLEEMTNEILQNEPNQWRAGIELKLLDACKNIGLEKDGSCEVTRML